MIKGSSSDKEENDNKIKPVTSRKRNKKGTYMGR